MANETNNKVFPHNSCVGSKIITTKNVTELIDKEKYQNTFPNSYPTIVSFQLLALSDKIDVQINNGEIQTINKDWQIRFNDNVKINSCKILTNGVTVIWSGILL